MKKEFALAFNEVIDDKQLPREVIIEALESAMVSAYRKTVNASAAQEISSKVDDHSGEVIIFAEKEVVEDVQDMHTEVLIDDARKEHPDVELNEIVMVESTPENFGRVAAQTARQVVQQRIREAERAAQMEYFSEQVGEIVNGIVQAANPHMVTLGLDRKAEGKMPRSHQISGERFRVHDRVRALLLEVKDTPRGPEIILTRGHRDFLRRLLEDEVPEIYQGLVEIRSIAREPGYRSKVAVSALQAGIDPVGACVGIRGVRIQAIVRELHDEKIDVIEWNPDPSQFIAKALSPARVAGVFLDERADGSKTATVVVPEDQLSLAIGRDGQNARLAAKLTGWRIDIKSLPEATSDALFKLENDPSFAEEAAALSENIPLVEGILAKKAEGRPIPPEEYKLLGDFVNHTEMGAQKRRQEVLESELAERAKVLDKIPPAAFDLEIVDLALAAGIESKLIDAGFSKIGELMLQLEMDTEPILAISGIGPKAVENIQKTIENFEFPEIEEEELVELETEETEDAIEPSDDEPLSEVDPVDEAEGSDQAESVSTTDEVQEIQASKTQDELKEADSPMTETKKKGKAEKSKQSETAVQEKGSPTVEEIFAQTEAKLLGKKRKRPQTTLPKTSTSPEVEKEDPKKKKKKKKHDLEYDPDHDVTIIRRRREDDWEGEDW